METHPRAAPFFTIDFLCLRLPKPLKRFLGRSFLRIGETRAKAIIGRIDACVPKSIVHISGWVWKESN